MADNYIERQYEAYQARKAAWEKERKYKKKKPAAPAEAPHRSGAFLQNQVKKVVAVHDLSGVGHVSLMAVIPVLSSMGFQVCPLPTAVLSAHTQYPTYSFLDLTDEMKRIIENWEKMNEAHHRELGEDERALRYFLHGLSGFAATGTDCGGVYPEVPWGE